MSQEAGRVVDSQTVDPRWRDLYIAGGVAALVAVLFFRRNFGTEMVAFKGFGIFQVPMVHPSTAAGWFALLQDDALVGLLTDPIGEVALAPERTGVTPQTQA